MSGSSMHSMTIETSSRSATSASSARSTGWASSSSASSASVRPAHSGWLAANEMRMPAQPGSLATPFQPETPSAISAATRSRMCGSASAARQASTPRPWSSGGRIAASVVAAAVYGYWSAATSSPSARAASSRAIASPALPQTAREAHFRCETCSRAPARRPGRWRWLVERRQQVVRFVAHVGRVQPAARAAPPDQVSTRPPCVHPGRVDEPGRQAERPGIHRRLDRADHAASSSVPAVAPRRP